MKEFVEEFVGKHKGEKYIVVIGDKYNNLKIKSLYRLNSRRYALCECSCGNIVEVELKSLLSGNTKSCGCYNSYLCQKRNFKHGDSIRGHKTKLYNIWIEMRRRCYTKSCKSYKDYGGRGITICDEWSTFPPFKEWAINNGYKEGLSIERINVNDNYSPLNCIWIPKNQQSKNRRTSHFITYNGKTQTISEWSRELGISRGTILNRLNKNLSLDEVLKSQQ